jgi:arylsulfatase A-like enzyme
LQASVSFTDHNIGQLLGTIEELGLSNKLIIVFHGDHGYQLGERNIYCKETNFNLAAHVPLMIRAPGIPSSAGARTSAMAEVVDVFPTMIELAGQYSPWILSNCTGPTTLD